MSTGGDRRGAQRHGADRLDPAQHQDLVGAGEMHRRDDGRMRAALERRRRGHDALHPGDLGRQHAHMRRGDHRVFAARHVAADRIDRDVLVAEHHARQRLDLDVAQGGLLRFGKAADIATAQT